MAVAVAQGNCFICGKTIGKAAAKAHMTREHNAGEQECYLLKAEGVYYKDYWIYFSIPLDASLSALDKFLRQIWCECCGHLSAFRSGRTEMKKSLKLSSLAVGDKFIYEYDFGSTTTIAITILGSIARKPRYEKVRLLARNAPLEIACRKCGAPATQLDGWQRVPYCDVCAEEETEDEWCLRPITNSPRCGECGYEGEQDKWTFDPAKVGQPEPDEPEVIWIGKKRKVARKI